MGKVTRLKTPQSVATFNAEEALHLVQAFHRQLRVKPLLELFHRQAATLMPLVGMQYISPSDIETFRDGERTEDFAQFRVRWHDNAVLGEMLFYFAAPQDDSVVQTAEDLVALMASPLHNAWQHEQALEAVTMDMPVVPEPIRHNVDDLVPFGEPQMPTDRTDTLLLIGLDSYPQLLQSNGIAWAQAVLQSVQQQVRNGLREADGVFQIDDGLLALLLPRTDHSAATAVAGKVSGLISSLQLASTEQADELTACMGIAVSRDADSAETVLERAERALEEARLKGPGKIQVSG